MKTGKEESFKIAENSPIHNKSKRNKSSFLSLFDRSLRTFDFLTDKDYREYVRNSKGMTKDLRQYDQKDLKYLRRDFRIDNRETSLIDQQIVTNKALENAIKKDIEVVPITSVKTDKGDVIIGHDQKRDVLMISNGHFVGNTNIPLWTRYEDSKLDKRLRNLGKVDSFELKSHDQHNLSSDRIRRIDDALSQSLKQTPMLQSHFNEHQRASRDKVHNENIIPINNFTTDSEEVSIGFMQSENKLYISNRSYNQKEVRSWELYDSNILHKQLDGLNSTKSLEIITHETNALPQSSRSQLNKDIDSAIERSSTLKSRFKHVGDFDHESTPDKNNKLVIATDEAGLDAKYNMLSNDNNNLVVARIGDPEQKPVMIHPEKSSDRAVLQNIDTVAAYDPLTVIGYNKADSNMYVGKLGADEKIVWVKKEDFETKLAPEEKKSFSDKYSRGEMIQSGTVKQSDNDLFMAKHVNGNIVYSSDLNNWHKEQKEIKNSSSLKETITQEVALDIAVKAASKSIGL